MPSHLQKESAKQLHEDSDSLKKTQKEYWLEWFNSNIIVRISFFVITVVLLQLFVVVSPVWELPSVNSLKISVCVFAVTISLGFLYWQACDHDCTKNKTLFVSVGSVLLHLAIIVLIHNHANNLPKSLVFEKLGLPYIMAPLLTTVLLGVKLGAFSVIAVTLLGVFYIQQDQDVQIQYLVTSLLTGMITVYMSRDVRNRKQLLQTGLLIGLLVLFLSVLFGLLKFDDPGLSSSEKMIAAGIAFSVSLMLSIIISGLFPVIEGAFRIITPISWLELTDMNHKLLKRLQLEAPGTFHHCLVVAQLAESAAEAIGANGSYCRVISLYHDIGKLKHPQYFIENLMDGEANPHDEFTPAMSARIIIAHVSDGVELAEEHNLNRLIIDAIQQHHGTSTAYFFYRKALEQRQEMEDKVKLGLAKVDDIPEINEKNFRYSGPNPGNKEIGVASLADIVESATRSLQKPTYEELTTMVDRVMKSRVVDGHLDDSGLTLGDLKLIRDSFVNTLKSMRHARIAYPKTEEKESRTKDENTPIESQQITEEIKEEKTSPVDEA